MSSDSTSPRPSPGLTVLWDLGAASRLSGLVMDEAIAESGMTARDFYVLSILSAQGPLTPSDMATRIAIPATTVSKLVARHADIGWVEERPNPDDGRSRLISLTDDGRRAIAAAQPGLGSMLDALYGDLGMEMADVIWSLRRLEWSLRKLAGAQLPDDAATRNRLPTWIRWSGPSLSADEETEVLRYIEWVVERRDRITPGT